MLAGEAGPERDLTALNAGAAIYVGGLAETIEQGTRKAEEAIDSGAARDVLEQFVERTTARERAAGVPGRGHARGARPPPQPGAALRARGAGRRARGGRPPVRRGAGAPGHVADRRAQAPLAVGGRDQRGPLVRRGGQGLRARRRRGAVGAHRGARTSAARSTTCAPRARPPTCRSCARTSPSTSTCCSRPRRLGADAVLLVVGAFHHGDQLADLFNTARALDLDAIVEVSEPEELEVALEADVDVIGINNRNLEDFSVDTARTYELLADVPAGKIVVSESGISTREQIEELERVGVDAVLAGSAVMARRRPRTRRKGAGRPRRRQVGAGAWTVPYHRGDGHRAPTRSARGSRAGRAPPRQPGQGRQGARRRSPRRARGAAGRGPRADRGQPGRGQDRAGARAGALDRRRVRARAVHRRPAARRRGGHRRLQPARGPVRVPARARCSPTWCWSTRSTARRPRRSRACSSACRSAT